MSFDLFIQCFGETELSGLSRDAVRALFPIDESSSQKDYWKVKYDDRNQADIDVTPLQADDRRLLHLCVNRPCAEQKLWDALFSILTMGEVVVFFPGGPLIVSSEKTAATLPPEMTEGFGPPICVDSGGSILKIIQES